MSNGDILNYVELNKYFGVKINPIGYTVTYEKDNIEFTFYRPFREVIIKNIKSYEAVRLVNYGNGFELVENKILSKNFKCFIDRIIPVVGGFYN
jgi:hypothetical protein